MLFDVTLPVRTLLVDDNHLYITHLGDGQQALGWLPSESARAGRSTGTRLGEVRVSTFREDQIARNEQLLTRIGRRRIYLMKAEMQPFLKARHLEMLDSWETSIQRRLASAWALRQEQ